MTAQVVRSSEPSGLLIFGIMLGLILLTLGVIALAGWLLSHIQTHGALGLLRRTWAALTLPQEPPMEATTPRARPSPARLRSQPLRTPRGRWSGSRSLPSLPARGNEGATTLRLGNDEVAASESEVTPSLPVTSLPDTVVVTVAEAALIAVRLSSGMAPSDVAKSLPGYSPKRNYQEYVAKVRRVKQELEQVQKLEEQVA